MKRWPTSSAGENYIRGRIKKGRFISDIVAVDVENIEERASKGHDKARGYRAGGRRR